MDPLQQTTQPIAICGMALRLPGGVSNPAEFWDLLVNGRDARSLIPESRFNASAYYSPSKKAGHIVTRHGYFLDESVELGALDASFFSMPKSEIERADPQQRILLELAYECLESAGEQGYRGSSIGTYIGSYGDDWHECVARDTQLNGFYKITGYGDFVLSNRISYEYDLKGPSMTIRTGCSSSLIGLHEACMAIRAGECTGALVGGTNLIMGPGLFVNMSEQGVLSPNGSSRSFDAGADGYARGEAVNMVYIKKLDDAIRDGNPIRAIIRGTSSTSDGKTSGLTMPNSDSHEAMIRRAYEVAGIQDHSSTAFVECHGTGTPVGDRIETQAVANVFGKKGVFIGSVKPNVGHSEGASGITSLIKSILALEHQTIPPNIKFDVPNPEIPFVEGKLTVPVEPVSWPRARAERVSINSFGIGGSNAHVVIESSRSFFGDAHKEQEVSHHHKSILLFSANTADSLRRQIVNHQKYFDGNPSSLSDLAYTLAMRRKHHPHRSFAIASAPCQLTVAGFEKTSSSRPEVVMVFTGQGAQWPQMGKELLDFNPVFASSIRLMDKILHNLPDGPTWYIIDELSKPAKFSNLDNAALSQPLCTAIQIALVNALADIGVKPYAVVGHSSGEIGAAYASGKISASEAIITAYYRGIVSSNITIPGAMAALGMGKDEVFPYLIPGVVVACENSPSSVTISGDKAAVEQVVETIKLEKPDMLARLLKVDKAYHSHHMTQVGLKYHSLVSKHVRGTSNLTKLSSTFFSSVTGELLTPAQLTNASYWQSNLESPVKFETAVINLVAYHQTQSPKKGLFFLEVGPHSALSGPLRQTLASIPIAYPYASCLKRGSDSTNAYLNSIGTLWQSGVMIDFSRLTNPDGNAKVLTDLPTYAWHHGQSYLLDRRLIREWKFKRFRKHELLGDRVAESTDLQPIWRNSLELNDVPWLRDHNIKGDVVFPCAGYIGMVGEAVRQLHHLESSDGKYKGFSMKNLVIDTAMVLAENKSAEIVTSLKKARLTDSLDSGWWEFVVSSHNGSSWTKHCVGQVKVRDCTAPQLNVEPRTSLKALPRRVDASRWYKAFQNVGANYGPFFRGLKDVSCEPVKHVATATAVVTELSDEFEYSLHPTQVDAFLQLFAVALAKGVERRLPKMMVPTFIEELQVQNFRGEFDMTVNAIETPRGGGRGGGEALNNSATILAMTGLEFSPLDQYLSMDSSDLHAAARVYWQPHVQFANMSSLVESIGDISKDLEAAHELCLVYIQQSLRRLKGIEPRAPHLKKFLNWMERQPLPNHDSNIETLTEELSGSFLKSGYVVGMAKIYHNIVSIMTEEKQPLEVLVSDGTLGRIYDNHFSDRSALYQALGHWNPRMRILEIGAGTGGTTNLVLNSLQSPNNQPLYNSYIYTDISAGFFPAAKERFKNYANMTFQTLDITKDPTEQGFEAESFDVILAANVLHATPSLTNTLENVRKLLRPDGILCMEELCSNLNAINFIVGVFPGWWLGEADGRADQPYVSPEIWNKHLQEAGFESFQSVHIDGSPQYKHCAVGITKPLVKPARPQAVTVLHDTASEDLAIRVTGLLADGGFDSSQHNISDSLPLDNDIISVIDLHSPFLDNIELSNYQKFHALVMGLDQSKTGILWLTRCCQVGCIDPRWAQIIGTTRTIRTELGIDFATCELEDMSDFSLASAIKVFSHFHKREFNKTMWPDYEWAVIRKAVHVPRLYPVVVKDELSHLPEDSTNTIYELKIGTFGQLNSIKWIPRERESVANEDVEFEAKAVGMNFRDILTTMGVIDSESRSLGCEASGIVKSVGSEVKHLKVGDRIMAFGRGCFSTGRVIPGRYCVKIPDSISFEDAATIPCVFMTVIYGLLDVGRLAEGQSVLIHSACGGVGLAAIQICKMIGAKIFCTVGNEEKVEYLVSNYGIPRSCIFNSRDASFLPDVLEATSGRGVDVVLNSLSGELLHASWKCVAEFGQMVEIGKRDLTGRGNLALEPFLLNRSYHGVDLAHISAIRPQLCYNLLQRTVQYYEEGFIKPIRPITTFTTDTVQDCFRYMQKGQHIGKIVVSLASENIKDLARVKVPIQTKFHADASYLLVGGLGGLGRLISNWMVEQGARSLVYLSRTAGQNMEDRLLFDELCSQGCTVTAIKGSVTILSDVEKALVAAPRPVKGVFNMSMVLCDQTFPNMRFEEWNTAVSPKVQGTWNLHRACQALNLHLDFFMLFSSLSGIIGNRGQANYAGANTFLDAFVQYRRNIGLNASVLDIGAMIDYGYIADNERLQARMEMLGFNGIKSTQLLDSINAVIAAPKVVPLPKYQQLYCETSQLVLGLRSSMPLSDPSNFTVWKEDRRMSIYYNAGTDSATSSQKTEGAGVLKAFITSALKNPSTLDSADSKSFIARQIAMHLLKLLLRPVEDEKDIDPTISLQDLGLDSLVAIEMRPWWRITFGFEISVLEMLGMGTLMSLSERAIEGVKELAHIETDDKDDEAGKRGREDILVTKMP
ncbi:KR domain-containing protein [Mariannaea sp. PMI_226]|nr:KR domain-containing protein [Mariannaea sp. PMI_226]